MSQCLKCKQSYQSEDPNDIAGEGYCPPCFEEKKAIAIKIDQKMANRPPSKMNIPFDQRPKIPGTNIIDVRF